MSKLLWLLLITWLGTASLVDSGVLADWEFYQEGVIHWYDYPGEERKMTNGELFDPTKPIFAHRHLPLGTVVLVVTEHGAWVGEIQDRGPYCPKEGAEGNNGLSLGEIDLGGDCEVVLDVSPMVAGELLGEFGYNDRGVAYGEAWGRIYLLLKGEEDRPSPRSALTERDVRYLEPHDWRPPPLSSIQPFLATSRSVPSNSNGFVGCE
jgi:hypothetical protein